jgi:hypothetical protein
MKLHNYCTTRGILLIFTGFLTLLFFGCGGGTSGTDGGGSFRSTISGSLEDEEGKGIAQASVLLENTADSGTTGADGSFSISADISSEPLALTVRTQDGQGGSVDLGTLSPETPNAFVILILDQSGNIRVRSIQVTPLPTPTPAPSPTPSGIERPPPQSTASPTTPPPTEATLFFEIRVQDREGDPRSGVLVSVENSAATTNVAGLATFSVNYEGGSIRIVFAQGDFGGTVLLGRIPIQNARIEITIEISSDVEPQSPANPNGKCSLRGDGSGAPKPKPGCTLKPKVKSKNRTPRP